MQAVSDRWIGGAGVSNKDREAAARRMAREIATSGIEMRTLHDGETIREFCDCGLTDKITAALEANTRATVAACADLVKRGADGVRPSVDIRYTTTQFVGQLRRVEAVIRALAPEGAKDGS